MQLRFASFAVISLREDFHLQECARAGRTKKAIGATTDGSFQPPHSAVEGDDAYLFTGEAGSNRYAITSAICCWVRTPFAPMRGMLVQAK